MSTKQWQRVAEFFQAALEQPAEERRAFLQEICGNDTELQRNVLALLEADKEAGEFMENPLSQATFEAIELATRTSVFRRRDWSGHLT